MGHEGHRERLRAKALKEATETHEKLELLLFSALPRVNTNEIAHELLQTFGDINGVFCAPIEQLMLIDGVGKAAAVQIRNVAAIIREYEMTQCPTNQLLDRRNELEQYLISLFAGVPVEITYMLMFSRTKKFLGYKAIGKGDATQNTVFLVKAIRYAYEKKAKSVIMVHNHPNRLPYPSDVDIRSSHAMNVAFSKNGMTVRNHFIVSGGICTEIDKDRIDGKTVF